MLAFLGVGKLIFYKSTNPWIFGLYSLPYFTFIILSIGTTIYIGFLFYRFKTKALYILLGNFLIICVIGITVEIIGQTYAYFHPSYAVMGWIPDKVLGWKLHPNFKFINTGTYWYARDFSTPIQTNSFGFRDLERDVKKPGGTTRIALLGDSFVEALQVPIEKTAGQILEKRLNHNLDGLLVNDNKYQVLNFGVSAYGIGQSFLVNRHYASLFKPDYVFIFIFDFHIWRTVGNNIIRDNDILAIRPAFWMREEGLNKLVGILNFRNFHNFVMKLDVQPVKNDKSIKFLQKLYNLLIKEQISVITLEKMLQLSSVIDNEKLFMFPNLEHEKYLRVQEERIKAEFNGSRTIKYGPKFFLLDLIDQLRLSLNEIQKRYDFKNEINLLKSI